MVRCSSNKSNKSCKTLSPPPPPVLTNTSCQLPDSHLHLQEGGSGCQLECRKWAQLFLQIFYPCFSGSDKCSATSSVPLESLQIFPSAYLEPAKNQLQWEMLNFKVHVFAVYTIQNRKLNTVECSRVKSQHSPA